MSLQKLTDYFMDHITSVSNTNESLREKSEEFFKEKLDNGMTHKQIAVTLKEYKDSYPNEFINTPNKIFNEQKTITSNNPNNLIKQDEFYYHQALRIIPPPVRSRIDEDGNIIHDEQEWYLEMKEEFTLDDLVEYYYNKFNLQERLRNPRRDKGAFKKVLLPKYSVDQLLFIIDAAWTQIITEDLSPPSTPLHLDRYAKEGLDGWYDAMTISKQMGEKIVPRV